MSVTLRAGFVWRCLPSSLEYHQHRYARAPDDCVTRGILWLDLGAGSRLHGGWRGTPPEAVSRLAGRLVGCDIVPEHLRLHPHLSDRVVADAERLPFDDGAFDLVSANMVLEHLSAPDLVFGEIARVLKPGGRLVFVTPSRGHPVVAAASILLGSASRRRLGSLLERRPPDRVFPTFYRANTERALRRLASSSGLDVDRLEPFSSYPMLGGPLAVLEAVLIWTCLLPLLRGCRSNLLGVFRRPAERLVLELRPIPPSGEGVQAGRPPADAVPAAGPARRPN